MPYFQSEVLLALLTTFTVTKLFGLFQPWKNLLKGFWIAIPLNSSDPKRPKVTHLQVGVVQLGNRLKMLCTEGCSSLSTVVYSLSLGLSNAVFYAFLHTLFPNVFSSPLPCAVVVLICIIRLGILQITYLRRHLVFRYASFQSLLPIVLILSVCLVAAIIMDNVPLHSILQLDLLQYRTKSLIRQFQRLLFPFDLYSVIWETLNKGMVLTILVCLVLITCAVAPTIEEISSISCAMNDANAHIHPKFIPLLKRCHTNTVSLFFFLSLALFFPAIERIFIQLGIGIEAYRMIRFSLCGILIMIKLTHCMAFVQASIFMQSRPLVDLVETTDTTVNPNSGEISNSPEVERALKVVSLSNRTIATRLGELLLLPTLLFLLICAVGVLSFTSTPPATSPPEFLYTLHSTKGTFQRLLHTASKECFLNVSKSEDSSKHPTLMEEVFCDLLESHISKPSNTVSSLEKSTPLPMIISPFSAEQHIETSNDQYTIWPVLIAYIWGNKLQKDEAHTILSSISYENAVSWFRYSMPSLTPQHILPLLYCVALVCLNIIGCYCVVIQLVTYLRMRRQGPHRGSIWGPELHTTKSFKLQD